MVPKISISTKHGTGSAMSNVVCEHLLKPCLLPDGKIKWDVSMRQKLQFMKKHNFLFYVLVKENQILF